MPLSELPFPKPKMEIGLPLHRCIAEYTASAPVEGTVPTLTRPDALRMCERNSSQERGERRVALPKGSLLPICRQQSPSSRLGWQCTKAASGWLLGGRSTEEELPGALVSARMGPLHKSWAQVLVLLSTGEVRPAAFDPVSV